MCLPPHVIHVSPQRLRNEEMKTMTHKKMWLIAPVLYLVSLAAYGGEALVDGLHLKPASAVVKVGGTVKLSLDNCVVVDKALGKKPKAKSDSKPKKKYYGEGVADDELAPLPDWKLVCEGDDGYDVPPRSC